MYTNKIQVERHLHQIDDDLELAICNNIACDSPTFKTIDSDGRKGKYSSLVLNSSGFPVISYYDGTDFLKWES